MTESHEEAQGETPTQWQAPPPHDGGQSLFESEERTDSAPHPASSTEQPAAPGSGYDVNAPTQYAAPNQPAGLQPQATQFPQYQQAHYPQQPQQGQNPYQQLQQQDPNLPPLRPEYQQAPQQQVQNQQAPQQQVQNQQVQQQSQQQLPDGQYDRHTHVGVTDLSSTELVRQMKRTPKSGWRKAVYRSSGKLLNPGESPADRKHRELIARVNQPLRGCYKIAMLSLKGGVGKTTTTTTLGATFASFRGDRVVAVDANPDRGTLSQKLPLETTATVRHLLRDEAEITRYSDVRAYTSQGASRLEILASEQDPAVSEAFSEEDYRRVVSKLEHFYNLVITDCGTGLMHSAMKGVLDLADSLVIVSSGSVDGARSASATLDWLDAHGYGSLVQRSVAVINSVRPKRGSVDLDKLSQHFGARMRGVCQVPFDPHLEEGAEIDLDRLEDETRASLLELAATVADGFPGERLG